MSSSPPFRLRGLDHVVLLVTDMELAKRFYCEVVGCSIDRELPQYGMAQLRAGDSLIDLVDIASDEDAWARPPVDGGRNLDHLCLATTGFDPEDCGTTSKRAASGSRRKASATARRARAIRSTSRTRSAIKSS